MERPKVNFGALFSIESEWEIHTIACILLQCGICWHFLHNPSTKMGDILYCQDGSTTLGWLFCKFQLVMERSMMLKLLHKTTVHATCHFHHIPMSYHLGVNIQLHIRNGLVRLKDQLLLELGFHFRSMEDFDKLDLLGMGVVVERDDG